MTQFEPLTDDSLQQASADDLTVQDITGALKKHRLDFKYVVHDPFRALFSTYYADCDRGLCRELFLPRNMIERP